MCQNQNLPDPSSSLEAESNFSMTLPWSDLMKHSGLSVPCLQPHTSCPCLRLPDRILISSHCMAIFPIITWCWLIAKTSSKLGPSWVIRGAAYNAHRGLWDAHTQKELGCGLGSYPPPAASGLFWKALLPAGLQICLSRSNQRAACRRWEERNGNETHGYQENRILTTAISETSSWGNFIILSWLPNTRQELQSKEIPHWVSFILL